MTTGTRQSTVLAVDDEYANRFLLESTLVEYDVTSVSSAAEMWAALDDLREKPDLILLDVMMPNESGFDAARRLSRDPRFRDIPVVFLSARVDGDAVAEGLSVGGRDYVRKPFDANELRARVSTIIGRSRQESALREEEAFLRREIDLARRVHQSLIPADLPPLAGYQMAARTIPARLLSGDLYDWAYRSPDELIITVADIAGKGLPAAMLASSYKTAIRASVRRSASPAQLISIANEMLYEELSAADLFITCVVLVVNTRAHTVRTASAGHTPIVVLRRSGALESLPATGPPLGIVEKLQLEEHAMTLEPGESALIVSDGVTEATNQEGEFFGDDRLIDLCSSLTRRTAGHIAEATSRTVAEFRRDEPLSDDISLVVISRNAAPERFELEAELESIDVLVDAIEHRRDLNKTERYRCELIASELLTNIIRHGYDHCSGRIICDFASDDRTIQLDVWEHGAPLERLPPAGREIDPRELPADEIPEGGYGMGILHSLCELGYEPETPKGNHWRCIYHREKEV